MQADVREFAKARGINVTEGRTCGTCTACCKVYDVPNDAGGFISREGEWCSFCAIGEGCTVYTMRPKACVDYDCMWRMGFFGDDERPDKSKIVVALSTGYTADGTPGDMWQLNETTNGAGDTKRCKKLMRELFKICPLQVGLARADGTKDVLTANGWERVHEREPIDPPKIVLP